MSADTPTVLAFAGSLRRGSFNKKAVRVAAEFARAAGADVTLVDLAEFPMPPYDGDLEEREGLPQHARRFKALMKAHRGFLISTPEYNSSIPGAFKNVIDWASRSEPGEGVLECFRGKTAALMSASPGALGGMRSLAALRLVLENIGVMAIPQQVAIPAADQAFADDGRLNDRKREAAVQAMAEALVALLRRLG